MNEQLRGHLQALLGQQVSQPNTRLLLEQMLQMRFTEVELACDIGDFLRRITDRNASPWIQRTIATDPTGCTTN